MDQANELFTHKCIKYLTIFVHTEQLISDAWSLNLAPSMCWRQHELTVYCILVGKLDPKL